MHQKWTPYIYIQKSRHGMWLLRYKKKCVEMKKNFKMSKKCKTLPYVFFRVPKMAPINEKVQKTDRKKCQKTAPKMKPFDLYWLSRPFRACEKIVKKIFEKISTFSHFPHGEVEEFCSRKKSLKFRKFLVSKKQL